MPEPKKRSHLWALFLGLALCGATVAVPRLYGGGERVEPSVELLAIKGTQPRVITTPRALLAAEERLALRYHPAGYVLLWVWLVEPSKRLIPLIPPSPDPHATFGFHAETDGGTIDLPSLAQAPSGSILWVLFSPVPKRRVEIEAAFAKAPSPSAVRLPGRALVIPLDQGL